MCLQGECQFPTLSFPDTGGGEELDCSCAHKRNTEGLAMIRLSN